MASGRRLFLAYFGGREPVPALERGMDPAIVTAYAIAIEATGGMALRTERAFTVTRAEAYTRGDLTTRPNSTSARQMIEIWRSGTVMYPKASENTWISASPDLRSAVDHTLVYARPGDVIGELLLLDHGVRGGRGEFAGMSFGRDFLTPQTLASEGHAATFLRLRPYVDAATIVTLAGCQVASNALGRRLLMDIAGLLRVPVQGFVEDQYASPLRPGIEGTTLSCGASVCRPTRVSPFAATIYGAPADYGNVDPGWD